MSWLTLHDKRLFNDKVGDFSMRFSTTTTTHAPFSKLCQSALKLYERFEIELIAPLHGPILREQHSSTLSCIARGVIKSKTTKQQKNPLYFLPHKL